MSFAQQPYASFFVRLWQEPNEGSNGKPVWRGSIEHVQSGRKRHFVDLKIPVAFIEEVMNEGARTKNRYIA